MAHSKTASNKSTISAELARDGRSRRIEAVNFIVADALTDMISPNHFLADAIQNETIRLAIFQAPCKGEIIGIKLNALQYPRMAAAGSITLTPYKGVIGGSDVALATAIRADTEDFLYARADDNGAFTDEDVAAAESTPNDMTFLPASPVVDEDKYYLGSAQTFPGFSVNITTAAQAPVYTVVWEYYNGSAWVAIPDITDETEGLAVLTTGWKNVSWKNIPGDWATTAINAVTAYWVRANLTAFTSETTTPLGGQADILPFKDWYPETAENLILSTVADALNLVEGQLVYLEVVVSNHNVKQESNGLRVEVEWVPEEK